MGRNKPRHEFKQDGYRARDFCQHCMCHNCDPLFFVDTIATRKRTERKHSGICEGCGIDPCKCKNTKRTNEWDIKKKPYIFHA